MGSDEPWPGAAWGAPKPLETRWDTLTTLHPDEPGKDRWVKDAGGRGWYADCCDRHRPAEIIEARKAETERREAAERALAAQRQRPYHPAEPEPEVDVRDADIKPEPPGRFDFLRRRRP